MKILEILLVLIYIHSQSNNSFAQQEKDEPILYTYVDKLPKFVESGGLKNYVYSNLKWPNTFEGEGTVLISFTVKKNGKLNDIKIEKSLCTFCDQEVIRIFETTPLWEPGELNSTQVDVKMYFPVVFRIKE